MEVVVYWTLLCGIGCDHSRLVICPFTADWVSEVEYLCVLREEM